MSNVPGAMFIPGATFIPESRVLDFLLRHPIMVAHIIVVQCISTPNSQGCSVFAAKFPDVSVEKFKNSNFAYFLLHMQNIELHYCSLHCSKNCAIQLIGIGSTLISIIIYA